MRHPCFCKNHSHDQRAARPQVHRKKAGCRRIVHVGKRPYAGSWGLGMPHHRLDRRLLVHRGNTISPARGGNSDVVIDAIHFNGIVRISLANVRRRPFVRWRDERAQLNRLTSVRQRSCINPASHTSKHFRILMYFLCLRRSQVLFFSVWQVARLQPPRMSADAY